jgi:hypothetical protein
MFYLKNIKFRKQNITVKCYIGKNIDEEILNDFNFYNSKLEKYFLENKIKFNVVNINKKNKIGYFIYIGKKRYVLDGVYTDSDLIEKVQNYIIMD